MLTNVLDASAILALLNAELGADVVAESLPNAVVCAVNFAEVITKLIDRGATGAQVSEIMAALDLEIVNFDASLAVITGELRSRTRNLGLSLGDRACLALAQREQLPVLTTDKSWQALAPDFTVRLAR